MLLFYYNLIYIIILTLLKWRIKIKTSYFIVALFSLFTLDLFTIKVELGMFGLIFLLIISPLFKDEFPAHRDNELKLSAAPETTEDIDYNRNFNEFITDYFDVLQVGCNFKGIVIYEQKQDHYKIKKAFPRSFFNHLKPTVNLNHPIFTAFKQFNNDIKLSTHDHIITNLFTPANEEVFKTRNYLYDPYLINIIYQDELEEETFDRINSFLSLFNYLKTKLDQNNYQTTIQTLSEQLNHVINVNDVLSKFLSSIQEKIGYDSVIFTMIENGKHVIHQVYSNHAELMKYLNHTIIQENSLINLTTRNMHYLPINGRFDSSKNTLFGDETLFKQYHSVIVFPIKEQDQAVGTLTLLSKETGKYDERVISILKVMFNMLDISLSNARKYQEMQKMATTDGLTGLTNHRTFQEKLSEYIQRAKRFDKKIAVVLSDIDHFKLVNDTYGHPVGDEVLRSIAKIFRQNIRTIDLVARYGGEEFVLVIEDTDREAVYKLTNRIKEDIKKQAFIANNTTFHVSISMGFALYPDCSLDKQKLIDLADKALYYSKEHGRDQVKYFHDTE